MEARSKPMLSKSLEIMDLFSFKRIADEIGVKGSKTGGLVSVFAILLLIILFVLEFQAYLSPSMATSMALSSGTDEFVALRFNITFPSLPCSFAIVDVEDVMGTHKQNITKNVRKWRLSEAQRRLAISAEKKIITEDVDHHGNPISPELNNDNFKEFLDRHELVLVSFYAPWCIWCKRLHPVWEKTAGISNDRFGDAVSLAKVDCTKKESMQLCRDQHIQAYPTIIAYPNHDVHSHRYYRGDRTSDALTSYIRSLREEQLTVQAAARRLEKDAFGAVADALESDKDPDVSEDEVISGKEGCQVVGRLMVRKVGAVPSVVRRLQIPGNLHITLDSDLHSFDPAIINVSHIVHSFEFGPALPLAQMQALPPSLTRDLNRLGGRIAISEEPLVSQEHYMKVMGAEVRESATALEALSPTLYKYTAASNSYSVKPKQLSEEEEEDPDDAGNPVARFNFDFMPYSAITYSQRKPLYHFITQLCAIIGGVFTVIGLCDSVVFQTMRLRKKIALGKAG